MTEVTYKTPSWQDMHNYVAQAAEKIKAVDYRPDVVIGLSRGGLVPARLFCDVLHLKSCLAIKVDHWGVTATKDGEAKLSQGLHADLTGKKVLIVDDITDTGQSMKIAVDHINSLNPAEIKTTTLIHLKHSEYVPDFYGIDEDWAWFIFPWNYREDMVNIITKIQKENNFNRDDLKRKLHSFDLNVDDEELQGLLKDIEYINNGN